MAKEIVSEKGAKALLAPADGYTKLHPVKGEKALYVKVTPAGRRYYTFMGRIPAKAKNTTKATLGEVGVMSWDGATNEAKRWRDAIKLGHDPRKPVKEEGRLLTFEGGALAYLKEKAGNRQLQRPVELRRGHDRALRRQAGDRDQQTGRDGLHRHARHRLHQAQRLHRPSRHAPLVA